MTDQEMNDANDNVADSTLTDADEWKDKDNDTSSETVHDCNRVCDEKWWGNGKHPDMDLDTGPDSRLMLQKIYANPETYKPRLNTMLFNQSRALCAHFEKLMYLSNLEIDDQDPFRSLIDKILDRYLIKRYDHALRDLRKQIPLYKEFRFIDYDYYKKYCVLRLLEVYTIYKTNRIRKFQMRLNLVINDLCWHSFDITKHVEPLIALEFWHVACHYELKVGLPF